MFMGKHINKIFNIVLIVIVSLVLGYALRMHHESKIKDNYKSQAESDLSTLEEEFYSALKKPRSFLIFNGMFRVYPMSKTERIFSYRKANNSRNDNLQITKNMEDNGNQRGDMADNENKQVDIISDILLQNENEQIGIVSDAPSLNDLKQ